MLRPCEPDLKDNTLSPGAFVSLCLDSVLCLGGAASEVCSPIWNPASWGSGIAGGRQTQPPLCITPTGVGSGISGDSGWEIHAQEPERLYESMKKKRLFSPELINTPEKPFGIAAPSAHQIMSLKLPCCLCAHLRDLCQCVCARWMPVYHGVASGMVPLQLNSRCCPWPHPAFSESLGGTPPQHPFFSCSTSLPASEFLLGALYALCIVDLLGSLCTPLQNSPLDVVPKRYTLKKKMSTCLLK